MAVLENLNFTYINYPESSSPGFFSNDKICILFWIYLDFAFLVTSLESSTKYRFDRKFYVSSVSRLAAIECMYF